MNRAASFLAFVLALATLTACSGGEEAGEWVAQAEAANVDADRRLKAGDIEGACTKLQQAAETPVPLGARPEDARIVRQDLYARLATLEVGRDRAREAAAWATTGLALGRGPDVFTANLLIARGRAFERLGDPRGASGDYHDALIVTEGLLDQSLEGGKSHD